MERKITNTTIAIILMGAAARLLPHPPNVTPIAAMALLGGAYLAPALAFLVPLSALFLSDLVLGLHATMPFVYLSFLGTSALGLGLKNRRGTGFVLGACLISSLLFFIVTNFGVWLSSGIYAHDLTGFISCYAAALPFFRNSVLGDLFFTAALFSLETFSLKKLAAV